MIDASTQPLPINLIETRAVLAFCAGLGVGVEAELSRVARVDDDLDARRALTRWRGASWR